MSQNTDSSIPRKVAKNPHFSTRDACTRNAVCGARQSVPLDTMETGGWVCIQVTPLWFGLALPGVSF